MTKRKLMGKLNIADWDIIIFISAMKKAIVSSTAVLYIMISMQSKL